MGRATPSKAPPATVEKSALPSPSSAGGKRTKKGDAATAAATATAAAPEASLPALPSPGPASAGKRSKKGAVQDAPVAAVPSPASAGGKRTKKGEAATATAAAPEASLPAPDAVPSPSASGAKRKRANAAAAAPPSQHGGDASAARDAHVASPAPTPRTKLAAVDPAPVQRLSVIGHTDELILKVRLDPTQPSRAAQSCLTRGLVLFGGHRSHRIC